MIKKAQLHRPQQHILLNNYYMSTTRIDAQVNKVERAQFFDAPQQMMNVYNNFWMVYLYNFPTGKWSLRVDKNIVNISGSIGLYVPPYTPVEWSCASGWCQWTSYCVNAQPEASFPNSAIMFPVSPDFCAHSYDDLVNLIMDAKTYKKAGISSYPTLVTQKIQEFLNNNYAEPLNMSDISKELKIPQSSMIYNFKSTYGFPPVMYRSNLRVFDALQRIGQGEQLTKACYSSGFSDYSGFYRNFMEVIGINPNHFKTTQIV